MSFWIMLFNLALIVVTAILIYKNRKLDNQEPVRALFIVVIFLFVYSLFSN